MQGDNAEMTLLVTVHYFGGPTFTFPARVPDYVIGQMSELWETQTSRDVQVMTLDHRRFV